MSDRTAPAGRSAKRVSRRHLARRLPLACVLLIALFAGAAEARIYKYVDERGEAHFTDSLQQVPLAYRSQVRDISPEMQDMDGFRVVGGAKRAPAADAADDDSTPGFGDTASLGDFGADPAASGEMVAGLLESFGFGLILLALLAIPVLYVLSALVFKLACKLAGEDPPGLGRACTILLAQGLAGGAASGLISGIAMAMGLDETASLGTELAVTGSASIVSWMVNAAILSSMMSYGFGKSMLIGFVHTLLVIAMIGGPIAAVAGLALLLG